MRLQLSAGAFVALVLASSVARADLPLAPPVTSASDDGTAPRIAARSGLHLDSLHVGLAAFVQDGHGYQSQAGPDGAPGSQRLTVFEPQVLAVFSQGPRLTHRVWIPLDVVTAASPNAMDKTRPPDMISKASRQNEAGTVAWDGTYAIDSLSAVTFRSALHLEEDFRSWTAGLAGARLFAGENATVTAGVSHTYDWFDRLDTTGLRHGRTRRGTDSGNAGFTQVLTTTTVVHANYGITLQTGELGNTWNAVPLAGGGVGAEILPSSRLRHALVGRLAQWLPWNGALKGFYRFYSDDWGLAAHTVEGQLLQRLTPWLYVRSGYRYHTQTGARFYTSAAESLVNERTADSDLARLHAHSVSGGVQASFEVAGVGQVEMGATLERYLRSNDLEITVGMWTTGFRF